LTPSSSADRPRSRVVLIVALCATIALGLATRRYPSAFPDFVARYAGDAAWAAMVFWLAAIVRPRASAVVLGGIALGIAFAVELSQLYRAPWIDALRSTRIGALALGQGFLWSDLACYAVGALLAVAIDRAVRRRSGDELAASARL
jgi:hypothetical protein